MTRVERDKYAKLLRCCSYTRDLDEGRRVHALIRESLNCCNDRYLGNLLVQMYGKCRSPEDARRAFGEIDPKNIHSWTSMISTYIQNGYITHAQETFEAMPQRSVFVWNNMVAAYSQKGQLREANSYLVRMPEWNVVSLSLMVTAYAVQGEVAQAERVFKFIPDPDVVACTRMISLYGKCGRAEEAKEVFDRSSSRDVIAWNAMLSAYATNRHLHAACGVFENLPGRSVVSWTAMVEGYSQAGKLELAKELMSDMPEVSEVSLTVMIEAYGQNHDLLQAKEIFDTSMSRNVYSWTAMLTAYTDNGDFESSKAVFDQMPWWSVISCNSMIKAHVVHRDDADVVCHFFLAMPERNILSWNFMIAAFAQARRLQRLKSVFELMPGKNIVSWVTVLQAHAENGLFEEARVIYERIPEHNSFSRTMMLALYSQYGYLEEAKQVFHCIDKPDVVSRNAMLACYTQNGYHDEAKQLFNSMVERDVTSWNIIIGLYAHTGHVKSRNLEAAYSQSDREQQENALGSFHMMLLEGFKPNAITFSSILMCISHGGLVETGLKYLSSMISDHGLEPWSDHYLCIVDLLGRGGQLNAAEALIDEVPCLDLQVALGSLLGACKTYKDVERGARAAYRLFELDSRSPTPYVLLASLYSSVGRENDAQAVRKLMKDRNVVKQPGVSVIEVDKKLHRFKVGDTSHPRNEEIRRELQKLHEVIVEQGYVPQTREVLHDVSEEEKRKLLFNHSEKLAIAFGLISTEPCTTIRVLKNLRVCSDCHTAAKLMSKITTRRIIVRDTYRFHHFENGCCSCRDYW